ncbi:hypothetical protein EVAR_87153_1 [Eumeta japonica]|uniref:Uncharacterized protein n=1 Tax=Eumeta variegata TaxID=151549 RepID=A0A4C1VW34_EUMVA|nr:hypothetical protein EVAR_87153_1 [Eumeta japonica]
MDLLKFHLEIHEVLIKTSEKRLLQDEEEEPVVMPRKYQKGCGEGTWCCQQKALATDTLFSYTHDYATLTADVAEAIHPIYEDLNDIKLLESKVVEIAAYIAAGMFNEDTKTLLYFMSPLGVSLGTAVYAYVKKESAQRVTMSEARDMGTCEKEELHNNTNS